MGYDAEEIPEGEEDQRAPDPVADFPAKLEVLFQPHRYKVLYGGRDAAKSWSIARALLIQGASKPLRIICAREIHKSIEDSCHALLSDQIVNLGLGNFYRVQETMISGANGTEFTFHGLRHNVENIKSLEGADIVWVEEARNVSYNSWEKLIPTLRKDGSEIWISFNPELETDETYRRFVVNPPSEACLVEMNYTDNPWPSAVLVQHREDMRRNNPDEFLHVYGGKTRHMMPGAVFADELRSAAHQNRITRVPYKPGSAVNVYCDLGFGDNTSLWFIQHVGYEHRALRTYQNRLKLWDHYMQVIQDTHWTIGTIVLPHDGAHDNIRGKSIESITRAAGYRVKVNPRVQSKTIAINAAKEIFPLTVFDQDGCSDGLQAMRHYCWENTTSGMATREPKHDENSHYADAFMEFGMGHVENVRTNAAQEEVKRAMAKTFQVSIPVRESNGWMQ